MNPNATGRGQPALFEPCGTADSARRSAGAIGTRGWRWRFSPTASGGMRSARLRGAISPIPCVLFNSHAMTARSTTWFRFDAGSVRRTRLRRDRPPLRHPPHHAPVQRHRLIAAGRAHLLGRRRPLRPLATVAIPFEFRSIRDVPRLRRSIHTYENSRSLQFSYIS
jgi:hypothetical protein